MYECTYLYLPIHVSPSTGSFHTHPHIILPIAPHVYTPKLYAHVPTPVPVQYAIMARR
jgi:hypothetical protein